jgi:hypothetical protein
MKNTNNRTNTQKFFSTKDPEVRKQIAKVQQEYANVHFNQNGDIPKVIHAYNITDFHTIVELSSWANTYNKNRGVKTKAPTFKGHF